MYLTIKQLTLFLFAVALFVVTMTIILTNYTETERTFTTIQETNGLLLLKAVEK